MHKKTSPAETFRNEAEDLLIQIEEVALSLGRGSDKDEAVNRLFRAFHTIKGSGGMFGFAAVADFTHHVETLLDAVREGRGKLTSEMVAVLLAARDHIGTLLAADPNGPPVSGGEQIIAACQALIPGGGDPVPPPVAETVPAPESGAMATYRIFFRPNCNLMVAGTDPRLLLDELRALGSCLVEADSAALPPLEEMQPDGCYLVWRIELCTDRGITAIRDVFMFVEDGAELRIDEAASASPPPPARLLPAAPPVPVAVSEPEPPVAEVPLPVSRAEAPVPAVVLPQGNKAGTVAGGKSAPVRVASERLDLLVNLVGELVMTHSRIAQAASRSGNELLVTPVEDLERIVGSIRDAVLGIRMMPIGSTFSRFKRLVHDLSAELGKEIDLQIVGEDTELDKTVLDQLGDPLVHLVRNAVDHAIELPEERERQGKPRRATITLSAVHSGAHVVVSVIDGGRGLDLEAIRAKAVERHLIAPDASLSEREVVDLIFQPGFSTAKQLTSVSGRGVGMDVVRRQIEALRGGIQVTTVRGQGTTVALSLPLTLAIIEGQLVEIGHDQFIVPMAAVAENVELEPEQREQNNGRNVVAVRGELISYIRLRELFELRGPAPTIEKIVIVHHEGRRVGLVVDRVLGSHQTVIQSLGRYYRNIDVASGATIMGDGRVALILDLGGLIRTANRFPAATTGAVCAGAPN